MKDEFKASVSLTEAENLVKEFDASFDLKLNYQEF